MARTRFVDSVVDALRLDDDLLAVIQRDPEAVAHAAADKRLVANGGDQDREWAEGAHLDGAPVSNGEDTRTIGEDPAVVPCRALAAGKRVSRHSEVSVKACVQEGFEVFGVLANRHMER